MSDKGAEEILRRMGVAPGKSPVAPTKAPAAAPAGPTDLDNRLDQAVTLRGTARNAVLGAVVLRDDRVPVYLDGIPQWDGPTHGKTVEVSGTLRKKLLAPEAAVGPDGGVSHGVTGLNYVIENPRWITV